MVEGWTPAVQDLFLFCIYVSLLVPAQALAAQWFVCLTKNVLNRLKTKTVAEMSLWRGLTEKLFLQSETTGWSAFRCPLPGPCTTSLGPGSTGTGMPTEILHLPCQTCTNMQKFTPIACGYSSLDFKCTTWIYIKESGAYCHWVVTRAISQQV